jgi:hypothetical protein
MDDRNAQVGWSEAQWNRVREEVHQAWRAVRVAGSILPVYGALPRNTQVVPSERLHSDGTVDERSTAPLLEIALPVRLTRQQVLEEDLSSALLQFRRRATQLGQLEDWYIFNGIRPSVELLKSLGFTDPALGNFADKERSEPLLWRPSKTFMADLAPDGWPVVSGIPETIAGIDVRTEGLRRNNPGALGVVEGAALQAPNNGDGPAGLDHDGLMKAVVTAIQCLEEKGYVKPYVCVLGRRPFTAAHRPLKKSLAMPRDRLEPLIGSQLLHASAMNIPPQPFEGLAARWQFQGVLLSLSGDALDLAISVEATPEFRYVDRDGRLVFAVLERFALRIKDPNAITRLRFALVI